MHHFLDLDGLYEINRVWQHDDPKIFDLQEMSGQLSRLNIIH